MTRPLDALQVKLFVNRLAAGQDQPITKPEIWAVCGAFKAYRVSGEKHKVTDQERHSMLAFLFGKDSTKDLTRGQYAALMRWLKPVENENTIPSEMWSILKAQMIQQGQLSYVEMLDATGQ